MADLAALNRMVAQLEKQLDDYNLDMSKHQGVVAYDPDLDKKEKSRQYVDYYEKYIPYVQSQLAERIKERDEAEVADRENVERAPDRENNEVSRQQDDRDDQLENEPEPGR